jgi:WD40 repeat protein
LLVTSTGEEYRFWKAGSWKPIHRIARDRAGDLPGPMAFSPDSNLMALAHSRSLIRLIDLASKQEIATLESPVDQPLLSLCFSPDGSRLVTSGGPRGLQLWDLRAIRQRLKSMLLDWQLPDYPPAGKAKRAPRLRVTVVP